MFFELDLPVPEPALPLPPAYNPKGKGKQSAASNNTDPLPPPLLFNAAQIAALEARIELLAQLGYTVLVLNQTERGPIDPKGFVDILAGLLPVLNASPRKPKDVVFASRLTIVLDAKCEGGFGLTQANGPLLSGFDVLALRPTTLQTFSLACLTHSQPGPLTAHVITVPLSPRVPYQMKHTLIRTARKAGVVFEISCAGAIRGDEGWWGSAREVIRITKGKNVVVSSGSEPRGPRDLSNLAQLLDLAPDAAHDAVTGACRSMLIRARARRTYRSVLSEPTLIVPGVAPSVDPLKSALDVPAAVKEKSDAEDEGENNEAIQTDQSDSDTSRKRKRSNSAGRDRARKKKRR